MRLTLLIPALAAAPLMALALPATAQPASPPADAAVPTCSKTVTDHCIQRTGHARSGAEHGMAKHHKGMHHKGKHHMKMAHEAKSAAAKPAAPAKAR